jgi:hypothetical protein
MSDDESKERRFDQMLTRALQQRTESAPAGFTDRTLEHIRHMEEQKVLARLVTQQRLALAGCIVFGAAAIVFALAFPIITADMTERVRLWIYNITQNPNTLKLQLQLGIAIVVACGYGAYHLVNVLLSRNHNGA